MGQGQTKIVVEAATKLSAPEPAKEADLEAYSAFWRVPFTRKDSFTEVPSKVLNEWRRVNPQTFALLIVHLVHRLFQGVKKPDPLANEQVLMALRSLTRVLPIAFDGSRQDHFEETLFWKNKIPDPVGPPEPLIKADEVSVHSTVPSSSASQPTTSTSTQSKVDYNFTLPSFDGLLQGAPLAHRILDILRRLMFTPHFTIVPIQIEKGSELTKNSDIPFKYGWAPGVLTNEVEYYNQTSQFDANRTEVVLCMLTALSRRIYCTPQENDARGPDPWIDFLTLKPSPFTPVMFSSLMSVSFRYDPIGWGLPYNHVMGQDSAEQLMNVSLELLSILLEHRSNAQIQPAQYQQTPSHLASLAGAGPSTTAPSLGDTVNAAPSNSSVPGDPQAVPIAVSEPLPDRNCIIDLLQRLKPSDYDVVWKGVSRILNNPVVASNTYLPNSTKSVSCQQEMLTVFWQLIQLSRSFLLYIMKLADFVDIIYPVLHFILKGRKDPSQLGLVHLGVFFLLYLSGERDFSISLNKKFDKSIILDIPKYWDGTYADYLILALTQIFLDERRQLDSLWECILTILSNVSPYIKNLAMVTATRLLKLFQNMSRPKWLLSREKNHRYVFFFLETFNNILQYQYEGNTPLVYSIIAHKDYFFKLADLSKTAMTLSADSSASSDDHSAVTDASSVSTVPGGPQGPQVHTAAAQLAEVTFKWTQEWLDAWINRLPISTIIRFLNGIIPQVTAVVEGASTDQEKIMEYLKKTTLVGILPVPHPILIRHYSADKQTNLWFLRYVWGVIFSRHFMELQVFASTSPIFLYERPHMMATHHHHHKH